MNNIYYIYLKYYIHSRLISKTIWVLNHFLTLECYRKLCNRLYWKKIKPGTISYTTRCWIIFLSIVSAVWLAFFYDPTDPANLNSPSKKLSLFSRIFRKINENLQNILNYCRSIFPVVQFHHLRRHNAISSGNILLRQTQLAYIKNSSFLI